MSYKSKIKTINMKSTLKIIALAILVLSTITSKAQTLEDSLSVAFTQLDTAETIQEMQPASSKLDLLAVQFSSEWTANYYAAYAKAIISYQEPDVEKKDLLLDEADKYFSKINLVMPDSSEKFVLAALIANARLSVDGQNRWKEYGELFDQYLQKAKAINPNNPRIYYLKGISLFYTPKMFGGGKKKAKEYFEKATPLFETETKSSILEPYWGNKQTQYSLSQCQ
jgi:hypothetical protein